ncbi:unnamed protein product [Rotaria sordida]|uniref:Uncharacterized protein n=1 Tax=Rotaria sordida TaxID=392033 RepID=A0A814F611_9BILA|nr:unnamed protein product [Rotaria sordida]CAF0978731.1 unnamed protein product [Rotaria sordida]CAF1051359.1 unnamed protein product [Rotaria sordida]CAF1215260.1 unnamed protein product [Rotaria sordida]CAF3645537.1 unnamed protein product [Rotaria sordida]
MPFLLQSKISPISTENNNYIFFFYFFIGCYIICVSFLIYTLIRLLKYYLRQRQINSIYNEIINHPSQATTATAAVAVLLRNHNINEQDAVGIKNEFEFFQPLIIQTYDLPPIYMDTNQNPPPPDYKEHL